MRRKVLIVAILIFAMLLQCVMPLMTVNAATSVAITLNSNLYKAVKDGKYGYVNKNGDLIVNYIYDDAKEQNEFGYCAVKMLLGNSSEHRLNYYEEIKEKINAVAKTISDMNNNFFIKNDEEDIVNKEEYIDNFLNLIENYSENVFYDDVVNNEELIGDFFDYLIKEDVITIE